jgi:23S rRNA pseudouridine1911/1915/1917 synthase
MRVSSKVTAPFKQTAVADYLAARFTYRSLEEWQELVGNGRVFCNDSPCDLATRVRQGDVVACDLPDFTPANINLDYRIIYEDDWLLGVDKPPGLRVHSQGKFVTANLIYHLRYVHEPPYPEAHLVNRLDAQTSGVVVLARQTAVFPTILPTMSRLFAEGAVEKRYLAVVDTPPSPAAGTIDLPIGQTKGALRVNRFGVVDGGKTAVTHYQTRETSGQYTLLELRPQTGRTHQLRVHLAAIGCPIVGDALYRMDDAAYLAWVERGVHEGQMAAIGRQALHCAATHFSHPVTGQPTTFAAPLPADIAALMGEGVGGGE